MDENDELGCRININFVASHTCTEVHEGAKKKCSKQLFEIRGQGDA